MNIKPLKINNNLNINKPVILAPMAGITDLTFRSICKELGAGMVFTEMISAKGLVYGNQNTKDLLRTTDSERPVAVQLFGNEPDVMAEAVRIIEDISFDMIDINMGCPVPKIVGGLQGSAMMKDPVNSANVVRSMVKATNKPISVKIRKGFEADDNLGIEFAKRMEDAGASLISVHGRTKDQGYSGKADLEHIRLVKESVEVPVVGSGDVMSREDIFNMFNETNVDGVMVARGARGNPWIFSEHKPSLEDKLNMIIKHARMLVQSEGEYIGIRKMRSHAAWYTTGEPNSAQLRNKLMTVNTLKELETIIYDIM